MTLTLRNTKGSALTFSELDGNFTDLDNRMGHWDYNDVATTTTPIALSTTPVVLTNDGAGGFSTSSYALNGVPDIWDSTTNRFDFSSLELGDTVDFRFDVTVTTGGANRDITTRLNLGEGGAPYDLPLDFNSFKSAGAYQLVRFSSIYMGDTNTLNNPAYFSMQSDAASGDSVVVNGWYVRVHKWRA